MSNVEDLKLYLNIYNLYFCMAVSQTINSSYFYCIVNKKKDFCFTKNDFIVVAAVGFGFQFRFGWILVLFSYVCILDSINLVLMLLKRASSLKCTYSLSKLSFYIYCYCSSQSFHFYIMYGPNGAFFTNKEFELKKNFNMGSFVF